MQLIINNNIPIDVLLEDIRIDYQVIDARTFETERKNATSHEITLKATDAIRLAFGCPEMISSADAIRLSKNVTAMLVSDVTVIVGRVRFDKVKVVGKEVFYQFYIVADNGVWVNDLNEKHLFDLDWYKHDHTLNSENQVNSEIPNSYRPYLYPIIDNDNLGIFHVHNTNTFTSGGGGGGGHTNKTEFHIKGEMFTSDFTSKTISLFGFNESSYNVENISS